MSKTHNINFLPMIGDINIISFSIESEGDEIFEKIIRKAINRLKHLDPSLKGDKFQISTTSADLMVKNKYFLQTIDEVISIYGVSYCIKSPNIF